ncbi:MAG: hypothetical protein ACRDNS_12265, partial [Trebonia sp.]
PAQEARAWWERDHESQRQAARDARDELHRRGIRPEPEPRRPDAAAVEQAAEKTLSAWWQQLSTPGPGASHVDPDRWAQFKAEQTASIQARRDEAGAWWQQFETAAQTTEAALATQRENALAAGQSWPPAAGASATAPEAGTPAPGASGLIPPEADHEPSHVDPARWAQFKAEQTAAVEAGKAARTEAAARACPVTDAEVERYGTRAASAPREPNAPEPTVTDLAADVPATMPGVPGASAPGPEPQTTMEWWRELDTPEPAASHVDQARWAQFKAEQTAAVEADKAARREAAARPVIDPETALYGAQHHAQAAEAEREPLLAASAGHDDPGPHETTSEYHARMQSYAQWQPETHPEANPEHARDAQAAAAEHDAIEL